MDLVYLMPALMFVALALLLFSGFPVAWVLGGVGIIASSIGCYNVEPFTAFDIFSSFK